MLRLQSAIILGATTSLFLLHCTTEEPPVQPGTPAGEDAETETEREDGGADGSGGSTCETAKCESAADCSESLSGTAGCWQCVQNCCAPRAAGTGAEACVSNSYACAKSTCDGEGSCSAPEDVPDGTPCGTVCFFGNSTWCKAKGDANSCAGDTTQCTGADDRCALCPPSGCTASCAAAGSPTCP
jgi:hypothetical protein